jgi:hypothetical protein
VNRTVDNTELARAKQNPLIVVVALLWHEAGSAGGGPAISSYGTSTRREENCYFRSLVYVPIFVPTIRLAQILRRYVRQKHQI